MSAESPRLLEVGRIIKPHGLKGEVLVKLVTERTERLAPSSVLSTDRGDLAVVSSSVHQGRHIVTFDRIHGRDDAERWRGVMLRAEPLEIDDDTLWVHELIGCHVVDESDAAVGDVERGIVASVQENPASDLLVLDTGALVPLTFVVSGPTDGTVRVVVPAGLFELFES